MVAVRLTELEKNEIRNVVNQICAEHHAQWETISLFGSRTDLKKKGGDIDLYIRLKPLPALDLTQLKRKIHGALLESLGEQKIDVVLDDGAVEIGAFREIILSSKVDLWIQ